MPSETSAVNAAYIEARMKQFKLVDMREQYQELIRVASEQSMTYEDFLIMLLQAEETGKKRRQAERLTDAANFDSDKRLSDIDYRFNPNLDADKIQSLGRLEFMDNHENIIIIGPPGVGKSMIATGIGRNACEAGYKVLFVNAKELVDQLYEDMQKGYLKETLKQISKIPLLIIDELSYLKMDKERESLFFQIIRQRYEKSSLILGTFEVDCTGDTLDPMVEGMVKLMGVFAELERNMISERVTSGMRNAAAKGKVIGRLHTTVADIPQRFMKSYPLYEKHKINQSELARITGLNRGTVRKYIKMLEEIKTKYWEIRIFRKSIFMLLKKIRK